MSKKIDVKELKSKRGPKPKPEEEQFRLGRFTVNLPPVRVPQLQRVAAAQGLPVSAFLRMAVFNKLDELDRVA